MTSLRACVARLLATSACATGGGPRVPGAATSSSVALPAPAALAQPARVLLVSVHGLSPDRYLTAYGARAMPTLAALAQQGVAAESMRPVFPPAPYPAHATLVTGVSVAKHGVAAAGLDRASDLRAASLWRAVAEQGRTVAALDWPTTGGAAIADLAPDLAVGPGASWLDALASGGAGRAPEFARRAGGGDPAAAAPGAARDAALVTMACGLLLADPAPALLLLRLSQTQVALDAAGPDSEPADAAFAASDAELGRLVRCLGDAGLLQTTGIAVAGDHGTMPVHTEIRANAALAEAGLLVPSGRGVRGFDALSRSNGGSAFVYASSDDAALLARRVLDAAANETGVFRVLSAGDMVERGADPEAWFGLEAAPGYVFADAATAAPAGARIGCERGRLRDRRSAHGDRLRRVGPRSAPRLARAGAAPDRRGTDARALAGRIAGRGRRDARWSVGSRRRRCPRSASSRSRRRRAHREGNSAMAIEPGWCVILGASSGFGAAAARAFARGRPRRRWRAPRSPRDAAARRSRAKDVEAAGRRARFWNANAADAGTARRDRRGARALLSRRAARARAAALARVRHAEAAGRSRGEGRRVGARRSR